MNYIKNFDQLTGHGFSHGRKVALDCLNAALDAADTFKGTCRLVSPEGDQLRVGDRHFDLSRMRSIYVVGAGKGTFPIARALDRTLGKRITQGIVLVKEARSEKLENIQVREAGHPVPDRRSFEGALEIKTIASQARKGDLVFACLTGGCSALMVLPVEGITLEEKIQVNRLLLQTGAPISEINAVRKHLSQLKGGGLARLIHPATMITLTQDTAPEFLPWPDPALPDPSTFGDAIQVLRNYGLWEQTPEAVQRHLLAGLQDPSLETPKDIDGLETYLHDTGNPRSACLAAVEEARKLGYNAAVLSTKIEGESREVGVALAGIAKEIQLYGRPFRPPCVLLSAGETTVNLQGPAGEGGPNQELVLGFARSISGYAGITAVSIDSEGTDGPTLIAGGISDGETVKRAKAMGISLFDILKQHDASRALKALGDAVITGPTGTNVVNLRVMVIEDMHEIREHC